MLFLSWLNRRPWRGQKMTAFCMNHAVRKLEMCPVETRMPRQGVMSVTQNDFGEMIYRQPKAGHLWKRVQYDQGKMWKIA